MQSNRQRNPGARRTGEEDAEELRTALRTILCPTDFSGQAKTAFALALRLAHDYGAALVVLHVATPPPFVSHGELELALQGPTGYRKELLDKLSEYDDPGGTLEIASRLEVGDPVAEIVRVAEAIRCDLIVLATHGRGGLGRALLGSVAEGVLRKASCPVLTLKATPEDRENLAS